MNPTAAQALLPLLAVVVFLLATLVVYAARRALIGPAAAPARGPAGRPARFVHEWWEWLTSPRTWSPRRTAPVRRGERLAPVVPLRPHRRNASP